MPTTEINQEGLDAAVAAIPAGDRTDFAPGSGREAYFARYLPAFNETASPYGATELVFGGNVVSSVVGPLDEVWDGIGLVRYPGIEVFQKLIADSAYLAKAEPHRAAALADWRLYAATSLF
jgi:hypothetical protein